MQHNSNMSDNQSRIVMMISENKLAEIRIRMDGQNTIHTLGHIGYKIYCGNKIKLREDEKTPSVSIRRDGLIKDFGGSFSGDLIDLLQEYHNMSFVEAVEYISVCLGVEL